MNKNYRKNMFLFFVVSSLGLAGCPSDEVVSSITGECLQTNEFCDSSYVSGAYGVNSLPCCGNTDSCTTNAGASRPTCN